MATTIQTSKPVAKKNTAAVAAPKKPAVQAAPSKPVVRPSGVTPAQHLAAAKAPHGIVARPNVAKPAGVIAPTAAKPIAAKLNTEETAELRTALALVTAQLAEANARLAKLAAKPKKPEDEIRTKAELIGGIVVKAGDWRESYVGEMIPLNDFSARIEKNELVLDIPADTTAVAQAFVSMPRDMDPGGRGAVARSSGRIAIWLQETEGGDYQGLPMYLTQAELASVWGD